MGLPVHLGSPPTYDKSAPALRKQPAFLTIGDEDRRDQQMVLREVLAIVPEIRTMDEPSCSVEASSGSG
jgi:hypothetical protein